MIRSEVAFGLGAGVAPADVSGDSAVDARSTVGTMGLVIALYSGMGRMTHLRDALTEQWELERPRLPLVSTALKGLLALIGLGVALAVSFANSAAGGAVGTLLLRLVGLAQYSWAKVLLTVVSVLLALIVNWLVFLWVIALPPQPLISRRSTPRSRPPPVARIAQASVWCSSSRQCPNASWAGRRGGIHVSSGDTSSPSTRSKSTGARILGLRDGFGPADDPAGDWCRQFPGNLAALEYDIQPINVPPR